MDDCRNNQDPMRGISLLVPGVCYEVKSTSALARNFQEPQHQQKGSVRSSRDQQPAVCIPQAESTLPSCPPDKASLSFLSVMGETRRNHPRLHIRILQNAVNALLEAYPGVLFALDHSKISSNGYNVIPPVEPLFFDDPVYITVIKRSNIQFILTSIEQILPMLECSQYVKQSFEEICERWFEAKGKALDYYGILKELSLTFQSL